MPGLSIVSTPIGNLGDMTFRAVEVLKAADCILAEDTRISRRLLDHYSISRPMFSYHDRNKERVTPDLIKRLKEGETMALITDAGTPGVADPAFNLVRAALAEGIAVTPIPGASAILSALVCSGLPTDRFIFEYFLSHKSARRIKFFESIKTEKRTVIFYETPHRIIKVLGEMNDILGNIHVVIAREITKLYEEFMHGTPAELLEKFKSKPPRGEMVVLFNMRISDFTYLPPEATEDE